MHRILAVFVLCCGVLLCLPPARAAAQGGFTPAECLAEMPPERTVDCGTVQLPLHHDDPTGAQITLPIMIVRSTTSNDNRPLVLLQGGPGGDSIETFASILKKPDSTIPTDRDVLFFEQRGTTAATPSLNCSEITDITAQLYAPGVTDADQQQQWADAWQRCATRLRDAGVDLSAFNSTANADDVAAIATMLGHDSIDLYGVSYGSLLAQHVVRRHPGLVHALILDGVVPTAVNPQTQWIQSRQTAFNNLFSDCAADAACQRAYPGIATRLTTLITRLNAAPLTLELSDIATSTTHTVSFDGNDVADVLFQMMYDSEMATYVPMVIDQIDRGDLYAFRSIAGLLLFYDGMSEGMQATTTCAEETIPTPAEYAVPETALIPMTPATVTDDIAETTRWCAIAAVDRLDATVNAAVTSDVPTLVSSGRYDPITPAALAAKVVPGFSRAVVIETPNAAHGAILDNACAGQIFVAFLDAPEKTPDTSCLSAERTVFATRDRLAVTSAVAQALQGSNAIGGAAFAGLAGLLWLALGIVLRPLALVVRLVRQQTAPQRAVRVFHVAQFLTNISALFVFGALGYVIYDSAITQNSLAVFFGIPKTTLYTVSVWLFPVVTAVYLGSWVQLLRLRAQTVVGGIYTATTLLALMGVYAALIGLGVYPG